MAGAAATALGGGGDQTLPFMLWGFKIINCGQSSPHDWSTCPLAHQNEKARRRDPRVHDYLPDLCQTRARKMDCVFGESCPYAHNVYESWLHPLRYRTQMCRYGMSCVRPLCFFAHNADEYRDPPATAAWWQQQRLAAGLPPQVTAPPQLPLGGGQDYLPPGIPLMLGGAAAAAPAGGAPPPLALQPAYAAAAGGGGGDGGFGDAAAGLQLQVQQLQLQLLQHGAAASAGLQAGLSPGLGMVGGFPTMAAAQPVM